jgi:hypothetical protein
VISDDVKLALAVEAVFYEGTVDQLVADFVESRQAGLSREELLFVITKSLMGDVNDVPRLASLVAMAVALLAERTVPV